MNQYEIIEALEQGKNVYWKNEGYKVVLCGRYSLYTVFKYNDNMFVLMDCEYQDCYIGT